jgi:hypothetical protein
MHRDLECIKNFGFKTHPAFSDYMDALETVQHDNNIAGAWSAFLRALLPSSLRSFAPYSTNTLFTAGMMRSILFT